MDIEKGKREFMSIYRHLDFIAGQKLSIQAYRSFSRRFISRGNKSISAARKIVSALVADGLIDNDLRLTTLGEMTIYSEFTADQYQPKKQCTVLTLLDK